MSSRNIITIAKAINSDLAQQLSPPEEGLAANTQQVIAPSLIRNTRGYIERVANQINGAYENGWYDACAVMLRRLIETLIIEAFEHHGISKNIQNSAGDFLYLRDLIDRTISESTWNIGRNAKQAFSKLKDLGDKSAHSRRYIAQRSDIQPLLVDIRTVVQEMLFLAGLK